MSRERLGDALPETVVERVGGTSMMAERSVSGGDLVPLVSNGGGTFPEPPAADSDAEAKAFVRFCYRRRAVAWPELYDEMCAVAARGDYRGMDYEGLQRLGIGFALAALPRLAALAERVIAEERRPGRVAAIA